MMLSGLITQGFGFHNAGMTLNDRRVVEELFISECVKVLCTTSTLAQGVNLPARLVIIKSTSCYRGAGVGYTEYTPIELQQMIGRAGRPQFDTEGVAVVMTQQSNASSIEAQNSTPEVESRLEENITEHVNAEIVLGTITSIDTGVKWIKSTFMYVKMKKMKKIDEKEEKVKLMMANIIKKLKANNLVTADEDDTNILPTQMGICMSRYYISYATMVCIFQSSSTIEGLLLTISRSKELEKYRFKTENEKSLLKAISRDAQIRYPIKGAVNSVERKAFILIQAAFAWIPIENWSLKRDQSELLSHCWRICNCCREYFIMNKNIEGIINSILVSRSARNGMWYSSNYIMAQFPKIGEKLGTMLYDNHITSIEKILNTSDSEINRICEKKGSFGTDLLNCVRSVTRYTMSVKHNDGNITITLAQAKIKYTKEFASCYHLIVSNSKTLINYRVIRTAEKDSHIQISTAGLLGEIKIKLMNDKFIGFDLEETISIEQKNTIAKPNKKLEILRKHSAEPKKNKKKRVSMDALNKFEEHPAIPADQTIQIRNCKMQSNLNSFLKLRKSMPVLSTQNVNDDDLMELLNEYQKKEEHIVNDDEEMLKLLEEEPHRNKEIQNNCEDNDDELLKLLSQKSKTNNKNSDSNDDLLKLLIENPISTPKKALNPLTPSPNNNAYQTPVKNYNKPRAVRPNVIMEAEVTVNKNPFTYSEEQLFKKQELYNFNKPPTKVDQSMLCNKAMPNQKENIKLAQLTSDKENSNPEQQETKGSPNQLFSMIRKLFGK